MSRSRLLQFTFGLAISLALLYWIFLTVDWESVYGHLGNMRYWALIPSAVVLILHFCLRVWRWRYLLSDGDQTTFIQRYDSLMVGNLATFVLPLRAGEFVRPLMLSRIAAPGFMKAFVSVVLERFFDLATILFLFAILVMKAPGLDPQVYNAAYSLTLLAVAILLYIVVGSYWPQRIKAVSEKCLSILPRVISEKLLALIDDLLVGSAVLRNGRSLLAVMFLTALVWGSALVQHYVFFFFLDLEPTFWLSLSVMVVIALAVAFPSAPGFLGVFQAGWIGGLAIFEINRDIAVAYSIITHLFMFTMVIFLGLVSLLKRGLSLGQLTRRNGAGTSAGFA